MMIIEILINSFVISVLALERPVITSPVVPLASPLPERTVASETKSGDTATLEENLFKLRDPFRMPEVEITRATPKTELERYPIDAYKLIGVLTGPERLRALVLAPDGKSYFISERMKIGIRGGYIQKISIDSVKVREKIVNVVGQEENIESEIRMGPGPQMKEKNTAGETSNISGLSGSK
jgi:hypothetical protein